MPAIQGSWHWWCQPGEVSTMIAIQTTGVVLGNMIGQGGTGFVSSRYGWESAFIMAGFFMFIISLAWNLLITNKPDCDGKLVCFVKRKFAIAHNMSSEEKNFIIEHRQTKTDVKVPWKNILTSTPLYIVKGFSFRLKCRTYQIC